MTSAAAATVHLLQAAVRSLLGPEDLPERIAAARRHVEQIDTLGLRQALCDHRADELGSVRDWLAANRARLPPRSAAPATRGSLPEPTKVRIYRRDAFTCRYSRCRKRTLYSPVLREVANLFPDLLGTHSNWRPLEQHIVYWTCTSTLEHRVSFPHGGTDSEHNYLTACYCCQDAKNEYPLADHFWRVDDADEAMPPPAVEAERWDGLSWSLGCVRLALGKPLGNALTGRPLVARPRVGSVVRNLEGGYPYYVDDVDGLQARLRMLWTSGDQNVVARKGRWVDVSQGRWAELAPSLSGCPQPDSNRRSQP